mmetsp:Transcript_151372/g.267181  ORF Transcript_151372/g.267181 Transcript_151372/m.267181 type:complete len:235 (-) Transcript_151372:1179-1883(-)
MPMLLIHRLKGILSTLFSKSSNITGISGSQPLGTNVSQAADEKSWVFSLSALRSADSTKVPVMMFITARSANAMYKQKTRDSAPEISTCRGSTSVCQSTPPVIAIYKDKLLRSKDPNHSESSSESSSSPNLCVKTTCVWNTATMYIMSSSRTTVQHKARNEFEMELTIVARSEINCSRRTTRKMRRSLRMRSKRMKVTFPIGVSVAEDSCAVVSIPMTSINCEMTSNVSNIFHR